MASSDAPIRVAIIGCGGISTNHLAGYGHVPEAEPVACCDVVEERAADFARRAGIADVYTDYRDVMARDDIDMVDICAIDEVHAEIAVAALRAGKHALIEKPLAMTGEEGEAILEASRRSGRLAMCAQSLRWSPKMSALKRAIDEGRIGEPVYARFCQPSSPFWTEDQADDYRERGADWLLVHNGMHSFDLLSWLLGSLPARVFARSHPGQEWLPVHEYVTCTIRFAGGAIAQAEENRIMQPPGYPFHCEIYVVGTEGTIDLSDRLTHSVSLYNRDGYTLPGAHITWSLDDPDMPFACEIREFVRAIRSGGEPPVPLAFSLSVLRAVLAAAESLRTGRAVEVRP
ncbi:MAG: Gfo/Idh/MocA family oxidoreductase [Armatimonadetes bacterium]|nr:Gfo/Idh/MocA family oxidoreductase [Armatimonadota bacterium]